MEFALYGTTCAVGLAVGDFVSLGCLVDVLLFAIVDLVFLVVGIDLICDLIVWFVVRV